MKIKTIVLLMVVFSAKTAFSDPYRVHDLSRKSLQLNLYQQNFAVVTEKREISPVPGAALVEIEGVAQTLRPDTVIIEGEGIDVGGFTFTGERLSLPRLLEENLGKEATIVFSEPGGLRRERGILLSAGEEAVWRIGERIVALPVRDFGQSSLAWYEFDALPEGFGVKPILRAEASFGEKSRELSLSYQADGLGWSGRYLLTIDENTLKGSLEGWAVLSNYSGIDMPTAKIRLVAGEVSRETARDMASPMLAEGMGLARKAKAGMPEPEKEFEYQVFEMPGEITLKKNEARQVKYIGAPGVSAEKVRRFEWRTWYISGGVPEEKNVHPTVLLVLGNTEENNLGKPLPAGVARVYSYDPAKGRTLLGEDSIGNTQKDGTLELSIGSAFDIAAERKLLSTKQIDRWTSEADFEISIENAGEETEVEVSESFGGRFDVIQSSQPHQRRDADTEVFAVKLPKEGKAVLSFRVRIEQR